MEQIIKENDTEMVTQQEVKTEDMKPEEQPDHGQSEVPKEEP